MRYLFILSVTLTILVGAHRIPSHFAKAKEYSNRLILSQLKDYNLTTLYANAPIGYITDVKIYAFPTKPVVYIKLIPLVDNYISTKYENRSKIIEWEHVVPASWIAMSIPDAKEAWINGNSKCVTSSGNEYKGRQCAEKVSNVFNTAISDLYNLQPSLGSLNALRQAKPFCEVPNEEREFGETIDFEISKDCAEPSDDIKGDIARIFLYMNKKYNIIFPDHNNTIEKMKIWNDLDPENDWEKRKKDLLHKIYNMEF